MRPGVRLLYITMGLALALGVFLVVNSLGLIQFGGGEFQTAKNYALSLLEHNLNLARELGIPRDDTRVNLAYLRLEDSVSKAATPEELYHLVLTEMKKFEQTIREQALFNLTNWLDWVINQDPNLPSLDQSAEVKISFLADKTIAIEGGEILAQETLDKITAYTLPAELGFQTVSIAVEQADGLVMTRVKEPMIEEDPLTHMQNQYKSLEQEYNNMRAVAGYSEMLGPGLIISLMDAEDDLIYDENNIIHDVDVQEVVHLLWAGGAQGIAVGERRLVANSSIRCVGGPILVNYDPIPVKPLVIKAVGDPQAMMEYLEPLFSYYSNVRNLRVSVESVPDLRLPGKSLP